MKVPICDLGAQYRSIKKEVDFAILEVLEGGQFILSEKVKIFEETCASYIGRRFGIGVASGTDAILLSLLGAGIGHSDEVIVPAYTFFSTAGSVSRVGATPVFVDIDKRTFNILPEALERAITKKTKAVIPVHLFGQMANMEEIERIAKKHSILIFEDAAQAIGAKQNGRAAGRIGKTSCFSFYPTKNLGAYGDGGLVVTDEEEIAEKIRMLRVHGWKTKYYSVVIGMNSRLDALQAGILLAKLKKLDEWNQRRKEIAKKYDEALKGVKDIILPFVSKDNEHIYHQYVIRVNERERVRDFLSSRGVQTEVYYPFPLHLLPCYSHLGYRKGDFPEAESAARESLALPIYPEMSDEQLQFSIDSILEFFKRSHQ